jgi:hypothetical protein
MQLHHPLHGAATHWMKSGIAALLVLAACSQNESTANPSTGTAGTPAGAGGGAGTDMTAGSSGMTAGGAGSSAPTAGTGGAPAGTAGSTPAAGIGGNAGATSAGTGGTAAAGTGGASDAGSETGCTRELLQSTVDAYFTALAAHDPSSLPLADDVKFTENGEMLQLGEGLWETAGMVEYAQTALDVETCSSASQAVVPDGTMDIPLGLRLELTDQRITEVETIAVRPGDYSVFGSDFASDTGAIIAADGAIGWEQPVPAEQRNSRDEIADWIDKYFRIFPRGVCNVTDDCKRLENGGGSFDCTFGASCDSGPPGSGAAVMEPRLILVDEDTGIGVGFTMFMGNTDMHMYKMYGDQVHAVHAILGAASSSGWN